MTEDSTRRMHLMKYGGPRSTGAVTGVSIVKIPVGRLSENAVESVVAPVAVLVREGVVIVCCDQQRISQTLGVAQKPPVGCGAITRSPMEVGTSDGEEVCG